MLWFPLKVYPSIITVSLSICTTTFVSEHILTYLMTNIRTYNFSKKALQLDLHKQLKLKNMNRINLIGISLTIIVITIATIALKPIVKNELEYKVVIANTSEHIIKSVSIFGAGQDSGPIGPIKPGKQRHYIFIPEQDGSLEYLIHQNSKTIEGTVNANLKKGETGKVFVVIGEMYKVKVKDELGI